MRAVAADHIAAFENIGSAMAVLRRLDVMRLPDDVSREVTLARRTLSVAQSRLLEWIDEENKP